ncbi:MAG: hypothetical protein R2706_13655 [Acidimicrobiales bacterium]
MYRALHLSDDKQRIHGSTHVMDRDHALDLAGFLVGNRDPCGVAEGRVNERVDHIGVAELGRPIDPVLPS